MEIVATGKAWAAIGWDDGKIRIKGGRTTYEAIFAAWNKRGEGVCRLAKLVPAGDWVRQVVRYVDADTEIEFLGCQKTSKQDYPDLKWN